jgi:hypothetical protein
MVFYPEDEAKEETDHCEDVIILFVVFMESNAFP